MRTEDEAIKDSNCSIVTRGSIWWISGEWEDLSSDLDCSQEWMLILMCKASYSRLQIFREIEHSFVEQNVEKQYMQYLIFKI